MKTFFRAALIVLMLLCLMVLVPSGTVVRAEIVELALDTVKGMDLQVTGYLSATEYEDPSISVRIESGRIYDTNYLVAHVKIANASQLRTAMAQSYYSPSTISANTMSSRANAALAINGDFFSARNGVGYVARQGKVYRTKCDGAYDVLIIDDQGNLNILKNATKEDVTAFQGTPINGFTFGPGLVINGERQTGFPDMDNAALKPAQRTCLAQIGELEYLCICSEGPEDKGSTGLTLEQFAELVASFDGVINAYNLDGGSSTHMIFQNRKINSPNNPKDRPLCDIIYFASAYKP